jgi:2-polyprenyl-3-methyl-5-hydroxy-6-metoxy-1,4-benzoquinol methylase
VGKKDNWYLHQERYYRNEADEQERDSRYFFHLWGLLFDKLRPVSGERILEIGCNDGRYTLPLLRKGFSVTAVDISSNALDNLKKKAEAEGLLAGLKVMQANIEEFSSGKFDIIYCAQVLHHVFDLSAVFRNIHELLNVKGRLICLEPNPFNPYWHIHHLLIELKKKGKWKAESRIAQCTKHNLSSLLRKAGFTGINISGLMFFPPQAVNRFEDCLAWEERFARIPWIKHLLSFNLIEARRA